MSIAVHVAPVSEPSVERRPFWRRQFDDAPTAPQRIYDVVFAVLAPPVCFVLDRAVLADDRVLSEGESLLGRLALPVYGAAGISMAALSAWLVFRRSVGLWVVGPLFGGALAAFGIGAPMALLAVLALATGMGLGALGFVPLLAAFAYLRNGVRALRATRSLASPFLAASALWLGMGAAAVVPLGAAFLAHRTFHRALAAVQAEDARVRDRGVESLRRWAWLMDDGWFRRAAQRSTDPERRRLEEAYREIRGEDLRYPVD